ncbi:hypothetical protein P4O66_005921, partial [Electrophorus voltai]
AEVSPCPGHAVLCPTLNVVTRGALDPLAPPCPAHGSPCINHMSSTEQKVSASSVCHPVTHSHPPKTPQQAVEVGRVLYSLPSARAQPEGGDVRWVGVCDAISLACFQFKPTKSETQPQLPPVSFAAPFAVAKPFFKGPSLSRHPPRARTEEVAQEPQRERHPMQIRKQGAADTLASKSPPPPPRTKSGCRLAMGGGGFRKPPRSVECIGKRRTSGPEHAFQEGALHGRSN